MPLSTKSKPYKIPEYSMTGDLLAYLTCGLPYRYHSKGALPPSTPVQLWFGEFIHSFMEEAYVQWDTREELHEFPWEWKPTTREIELEIHRRLSSRGLQPPPNLFCTFSETSDKVGYCKDGDHPHRLLASRRTEASVNKWGIHLFPLISEVEVNLKGIQPMPNYRENVSRCNYYGVGGRIDVVTSVKIEEAGSGNLIIDHVRSNPRVKKEIAELDSGEYEIIIDYKGMRRPPTLDSGKSSSKNLMWSAHEWQILTYAWLRSLMRESKPVVAGILFYLNELYPSKEDIKELKRETPLKLSDVVPTGSDKRVLFKWKESEDVPSFSDSFIQKRSIRVIPVTAKKVQMGLSRFDSVVKEVEKSVLSETGGTPIPRCWKTNPVQKNCTACDFKTCCPNPAPRKYSPSAP